MLHRLLLPVACAIALPLTASAQTAALQSPLTGVTLPSGAKLDKGFLIRPAAKATMDMTAKDAGHSLGDKFEVYKLPLSADAQFADTFFASLTAQGWLVTAGKSSGNEKWAWIDKAGKRYMAYVLPPSKDLWIYLAEYKGIAPLASSVPAATPASAPAAAPATAPSATPKPTAAPAPVTNPSGPRRYQFTNTRFDDGWNVTEHAGYVEAVRGPVHARLIYRVTMDESMRPPVIATSDYFWNRDVRPRFDVLSEDRRTQELMYTPIDYREGDVRDRSTGQPGYLGMFVSKNSGGALNILVSAPDRSTFRQLYPKPEDLERVLGLNRFAVAPTDLPGYWSESSGATAQMYYVSTGAYAGMNAAATSAEFWFNADGSYRSTHKGATGMVGSQRVFQQEYKGRWTMNGNWEMSLSNRYEGKAEVFTVHFEAVQGGRILHLVRKDAPGVRYALVLSR